MGSLSTELTLPSYTRSGSGEPLFLIHAFPMDHAMWDAQVRYLSDRYQTFAPDLPGFGATPRAPGWRISGVAGSLLDIADREDLRSFGVVGLSMGAYAAFEIYRRARDRVRWLVLASGRARGDNDSERQARTNLIGRVQAEGLPLLNEVMLPRLLRQSPAPEIVASVRRTMARTTAESVADALEALRERADSTPLLADIRCPTLVIGGNADPITPPEESRALAERIPGACFVEIPKAGHLTNLENPEAFNEALAMFLDSAPEAPALF
jgi:pimeloyl-ACP methyl ester carboxylesterase